MMKVAWRTLAMGMLAMAGTACDETLCTNRNDAGQCPDFPEFDSGPDGMDATTRPPDAGTDGSTSDATVVVDSGMDGGTDAAAPVLTIQEFCDARYRVAKLWRDKFGECFCGNDTLEEQSIFLLGGFLYDDGSASDPESVSHCVDRLTAQVGANFQFVGSAAAACANVFASQFTEPPTDCPPDGLPIDAVEATQAKQFQDLPQLPECRAALVGKLARNAVCSGKEDYQCQPGLRCLNTGTGYICKDPLASGDACRDTRDCADGLACVGDVNGAGRVCRPKEQPVAVTAACTYSVECEQSAFCLDNQCTMPAIPFRTICGN